MNFYTDRQFPSKTLRKPKFDALDRKEHQWKNCFIARSDREGLSKHKDKPTEHVPTQRMLYISKPSTFEQLLAHASIHRERQ